MSAPAFGSISLATPKAYGAVLNGSDTITCVGSNPVLYGWWFTDAGGSANFITPSPTLSGGSSGNMTRVGGGTSGGGRNVELWRFVGPGISAPTSVHFDTTGGNNIFGALICYQDVDPTTPDHNFTFALGGSDLFPTVTVTSATGETVIDFVSTISPGLNGAVATASGQTRRFGTNAAGIPAGSDMPGASSVVPTWTLAGSEFWIDCGLSLMPVSAGGGTLKTVDGLAIASLKTVNGLAKASMKAMLGLTP